MIEKSKLLFERWLKSNSFLILFAVYPVFNAYSENAAAILFQQFARLSLLVFLGSLTIYFIFFFYLRRTFPSALAAAIIAAFFSYYGHFVGIFQLDGTGLLPLWWLLSSVIAVRFAIYIEPRLAGTDAIPALNLMALILILFPVIRLIRYASSQQIRVERTLPASISLVLPQTPPDIYYIILDAYTRPDVMKELYGYDANGFIESLEDLGFYTAKCSRANYGFTRYSIGSSLNVNYIQDISPDFKAEEVDLVYTFNILDDNLVRNSLEDAGYKTIAYGTGYYWLEWRDADLFISSPDLQGITDAEVQFLSGSYARVLENRGVISFNDLNGTQYRNRTQTTLNSINETIAFPSPKFVFMHIISPHHPYVFDRSGNPILPSSIKTEEQGYGGQSEFISNAILEVVTKLIAESATPPVIIIQGDHGRHGDPPREHAAILNTYYLPGHADQLYPSISPVNTFRVIFNEYFGGNLPLLEDVYYDNIDVLRSPYIFQPIPAEICP